MSLNIGFFLPWRNGYGRQQKAMFVPTRQKDVCAHGYQPRVCGYTVGVIARIDRATQYSKDPVMIRKGRGVLGGFNCSSQHFSEGGCDGEFCAS
ncbi:hypothetical protein, partial [Bradyrhizobium sp. CCH5-F6]|uniref:hypothetical protein n=1 Tax=Bradyrhizobium sp. CCH5-F6 TaxID=1768753 RepID=UPI001AEC9344